MPSLAVPFGQYVPGNTPVHRLDARAKLFITVAFTVALFATNSWWSMAICTIFVIASYAIARISPRLALRGLKPILFLLVVTLLINAIGRVSASAPNLWGWGVTLPGFVRGLYFAVRIVLLITSTTLLTYTTSPVELTDAMVSIMRPLAALRVPIEDIAMMFSIALRFIPTTAEEAEKLIVAQSARGARFDQRNLLKRIKAWIPILIPLFVNLFRRADALALAMESRCYTGEGRTHLRVYVLRPSDYGAMVVALAVCIALVVWL